jgi:hypothetical protein
MQFGEDMDRSAARDYIQRRLKIDRIKGDRAQRQIMARCLDHTYTTAGLDATYEHAKKRHANQRPLQPVKKTILENYDDEMLYNYYNKNKTTDRAKPPESIKR